MASWGKSLTKGATNTLKNTGSSLFKSAATNTAKNFFKDPNTYTNLLGSALGSLNKSGGSNASSGNAFTDTLSGLFGGGSSADGSSNIYGDLFKGILSGLGSSAAAKGDLEMAKEVTKIKGLEDRKTTAYEAELLDFYKKRDNYNKWRALDQYGQFSRVSQFAPGYKATYTGPADPGNTAPVPKA